MDLETRKITFVQEFLRLQNEEIVSGLEKLLRKRKIEQIEKEFNTLNEEKLNGELDQAMQDSEEGRMVKATDLKKLIQKWD